MSVEVYWFARVIRVFDLIVEVPKRVGKDQILKNFYLIESAAIGMPVTYNGRFYGALDEDSCSVQGVRGLGAGTNGFASNPILK